MGYFLVDRREQQRAQTQSAEHGAQRVREQGIDRQEGKDINTVVLKEHCCALLGGAVAGERA